MIKGLAVLINRIGKSNITVGVDGSLYRYHPRFKRNMERCMETLVNKNIKVFMRLHLPNRMSRWFSISARK
jgi:hypothetical protein